MKLSSFFKRFSSIRHSLFCCRGFQAFWENREKSGMSIEVHQRDGKPEFWLQMRVVDQAQEDLFRRIEKAKRLDLELLPETDQNRSCEAILWTESRIFHCPWCGKRLESFYAMNWKSLFSPVPEHKLKLSFGENKCDILAKVKCYPIEEGGSKTSIMTGIYPCAMFIEDAQTGYDCRLLLDGFTALSPSDEITVPIVFSCPELVLPHLTTGTRFNLWKVGFKAKGEILKINRNIDLLIDALTKLEDRENAFFLLTALYANATETERSRIRNGWDFSAEWLFPNPFRLACRQHEKHSCKEKIRASLLYDSIEDLRGECLREKLIGLAVIYHSCIAAGLDPQDEFEYAASLSTQKTADFFRDFISRKEEDKSIQAFALTVCKNTEGETEIYWPIQKLTTAPVPTMSDVGKE